MKKFRKLLLGVLVACAMLFTVGAVSAFTAGKDVISTAKLVISNEDFTVKQVVNFSTIKPITVYYVHEDGKYKAYSVIDLESQNPEELRNITSMEIEECSRTEVEGKCWYSANSLKEVAGVAFLLYNSKVSGRLKD